MKQALHWNEDYLMGFALAVSLGLHLLLFHAGQFSLQYHQKHIVEIDITNMGHLGMPGLPKRAAAPAPPKPVVPAKQWVAPRPNQKIEPAPIPTQPVAAPPPEEAPPASASTTGNGSGEFAIGTGDGSTNTLSRIPQLLNLSDLNAILRRFYPEAERESGHEGTVVLDIHIDTEGHISAVDVVRSAGADFDAAAVHVAKLLRFTPAFMGSQRVNVKMRQAIRFKLEL